MKNLRTIIKEKEDRELQSLFVNNELEINEDLINEGFLSNIWKKIKKFFMGEKDTDKLFHRLDYSQDINFSEAQKLKGQFEQMQKSLENSKIHFPGTYNYWITKKRFSIPKINKDNYNVIMYIHENCPFGCMVYTINSSIFSKKKRVVFIESAEINDYVVDREFGEEQAIKMIETFKKKMYPDSKVLVNYYNGPYNRTWQKKYDLTDTHKKKLDSSIDKQWFKDRQIDVEQVAEFV